MGLLANAALLDRTDESALQAAARDGTDTGVVHGCNVTARAGGEEPERVLVRAPEFAQERERAIGERHVAVQGALAVVDMDELAAAVDIGYLELGAFEQAQSTAVDGG